NPPARCWGWCGVRRAAAGIGHRPPQEERMSEATASCEKSRGALPFPLRATTNRGETRKEESDRFSDSSFLPPPASHRTAHLLFIGDDLPPTAQQLRGALPAPTRRVQFAGTGSVGLEQVRTLAPEVIILDLGLPDQSGLEVYQQIRRINARVP